MKTEELFTRLFSFTAEKHLQTGVLFMAMILLNLPGTSQPGKRSTSFPGPEAISKSLPDERVVMVTDRNIYLCGEDIVFDAFTFEGTWLLPVVSSSILYVELYNTDNKVISKGKYILAKGRGSGKIQIPREILSGIYYIRGYTNFMKNFGARQFFTGKLKIVNPFLGSPNMNQSGGSPADNDTIGDQFSEPAGKFAIALETDRKEYGNRGKINVKIKATDKNGDPVKSELTLLTVLAETGPSDNEFPDPIVFPMVRPGSEKLRLQDVRYLPEIKGDIISGRAVYEDNQPAEGVEVLQSFTGKSTRIESSVTDHEGRFRFLADTQNNRGDLILMTKTHDRKIKIIPDDEFFNDFPPPARETLHLTRDEIDLISKQFVNIQVDDAFPEGVNIEKEKSDGGLAFYGKDYAEYKFPDYLQLPNMKEFIFEVIEGVVYSRENRKDVLSIHEEKTLNKIGSDPLIVIDGVPVDDASAVTGLPSEKVQYIRVVRNKYLYKDQVFDGILDIVTYSNDALSFDLPEGTYRYNFVHADAGPVKIEARIKPDEKGRIPLYMNLLYWNSGINTDNDGIANVSFIAPDNTGTFEIKCFGLTPEGSVGSGSVTIKISN